MFSFQTVLEQTRTHESVKAFIYPLCYHMSNKGTLRQGTVG